LESQLLWIPTLGTQLLLRLVRHIHFRIGSWLRCIYCGNHFGHGCSDQSPSRLAQYNDGNLPLCKILLVADVLIGGDQRFETGTLRRGQQFTVCQPIPTLRFRFSNRVTNKESGDSAWCAVIKQNEHSRA
jgi:hypothetical protein